MQRVSSWLCGEERDEVTEAIPPNISSTAPFSTPPDASLNTNVSASELLDFRLAVTELAQAVAAIKAPSHAGEHERLVARRLAEPSFAPVLSRTPRGVDGTAAKLARELHRFVPNPRSSAVDHEALVRVYLLSQIDVMWWQNARPFETDDELLSSTELVDLDDLRRASAIRFVYRVQPRTFAVRAHRALMRRAVPTRSPLTIGLRLTRARPVTVALLNQCADDFDQKSASGTPALWVNSLVRSIEYQKQMRSVGYAVVMPSAHCAGYAVDVEMAWFRRSGAHEALQAVLLSRLEAGQVNVIDEGQAWHMCISPGAVAELQADYNQTIGL